MSEENLETKKNKEMQIITESEISSEKTDSKPEIQSLPTTEEKFLSSSNPNLQIIKKRYFGIDLIRVIACFLVMLIHSGEIYYINDEGGLIKDDNNIYPGVINSLSRVSVPLFVMISGYLLLPMKTDYSTFLKKRFTRVSFPFIAFCIFYDIYYYIRGRYTLGEMFWNIPGILLNFGTAVGHLWFMYMIMGVYLYIPIITPWIQTAKKEHFYYYFVIWIISSFSCYIHLFYGDVWGHAFWNSTNLVQSFLGDLGYAVLGAFIKLHLKENNLYILGLILYLVGSGVTMFGYFFMRDEAKTTADIEITWQFDSTNLVVSSFGIFLLLRKIECKNETISKIFNDIALKSYGMFLIHVFFVDLFKYLFDARNQFPLWCIFVIAILTFISSYLVIKVISYVPFSHYIIG
jgi:surface polysaccharide O-acyltransferase-like enzyme